MRVRLAAVFMAPTFVVIEILCKLGFLSEFHKELTAIVEPEVKAFHEARVKSEKENKSH